MRQIRFFGRNGGGVALLAALLAVLLPGCADDRCDPQSSIPCEFIDDDDSCTPTPVSCRRSPTEGNTLELKFSTPAPVRVAVYRGENYETGVLVWQGVPTTAVVGLSLPAEDYSATALYLRGGDSILVVNGVDLESESLSTCDGVCYSNGSATVDLRLAQ